MTLDQLDWLAYEFGDRHTAAPAWEMATAKQIHSAEILDACGSGGLKGQGDALISNTPGIAVGIRTADCVPILLADPANRVVAAVHAGWRGTAQEIVRLTVERLGQIYKTKPSDIVAAIGPAIRSCCFEVGPEVAREFARWDPQLEGAADKHYLDLVTFNARQLESAGVPSSNIVKTGECTKCDAEHFHSFRRDREESGRMLSWIGRKA